ncbi:MAG: hypothetical protein K2X74_06140 [Acetobacteraceae bacterium]|nr:hypothetical protein [Acetobacteraceae bacterium]
MTPIPLTAETQAVARRLIWFETPEDALADPAWLLAYALEAATHEDLRLLRRYVTEDDMRAALRAAPPGIIRPRSSAYWHARPGIDPAPPLPQRRLG